MNVIKWRQLINGDKLTPKSDFILGSNIHNQDGSIKLELFAGSINVGSPVSIGRGELINTYAISGDLTITIKTKQNIVGRTWIMDTLGDYDYAKNNNVVLFLGKPFKDNRYVIANYYDSENSNYGVQLINIDNGDVFIRNLSTSAPVTSFIYDGLETVYFVRGDNLHQVTLKKGIDFETTPQSPLVDNNGERIPIKRLYGMWNNYIFIKNKGFADGYVSQYDLTTKIVSPWGSGDAYNAVLFEDNILMSNAQNKVWFRKANNTYTNLNINQAMVDNGMIADDEIEVVPQLILDYEEDNTLIKFKMIYARAGITKSLGFGKFEINKSTDIVTITEKGWIDNILPNISIDELNNRFANSCNSYNIGKFYNYGLQTQWDNKDSKSIKITPYKLTAEDISKLIRSHTQPKKKRFGRK